MRTAVRFVRVGKITVRLVLWFCACNLVATILAAQCSNPTQVPNQTISSGTPSFTDTNALAASNVVINGSASVTFHAGNCIDLQPGFHATAGTAATTFHAWVGPTVATPTFSPGAGTYTSVQSVTLSTTTGGATIRYTTDGSTPSETVGTVYSGPVTVGSSMTITAIAYESGWLDSAVATAVYTLNPPAPPAVTLTAPANGAVNQPMSLTLTWVAAAGATSYDVYLGSGTSTFAGNTTNTSYTPGTALAGGTAYSWYVIANNASGSAPASSTWTFTTLAASLTIASAHSGTFTQGQSNATYTLMVANGVSAGPTNGVVAVTETAPSGLVPVGVQGAGWTCAGPTCVRSDALAPGSSYPAIALTVDVANNAPASVTNAATVAGGGSANASASDLTSIDALPIYSNPLAFAVPASVVAGAPTTFTVTYASQAGSGDIASGQVRIDSCYLGWDSAGNITLYGGPSGTLGQNATLQGFSCSINLANSSLSPVAGNPDAVTLSLAITFAEQSSGTDFFGAHEVYAWGTNAEELETAVVDLGAMVVSPGQDYTLTVSPSGTTTVPYMGTVILTVTATALNGFTGGVNLQIGLAPGSTNPCFSLWGDLPYLTANSQGSFTLQNNCQYGSSWTQFVITGNAPSIGVSRTGSSSPILVATAGGDFTITPGMPAPSNLPAGGSISYQVTVSSIGSQSGNVNLTLAPAAGSSMPAGVTYQFAPAQVYLSSSGSTQSTLTLSSTADTPGGTYPLVITGTLQATGAQRTAAFALGTQVTGFQVTSATGSGIVHNAGQEVQVTHSVPASNAPSYTTCGSADPDVTCRVISASAGTVTLGITASTSAVHGNRVLSLNGGAGMAHAAVGDVPPSGISVSPSEIQAGQWTTATVTLTGVGPSCGEDADCAPEVWVTDSQGSRVPWATSRFVDNIMHLIDAPPDEGGGDYDLWVWDCGDFFDPEWDSCLVGPWLITVVGAGGGGGTSVTLQVTNNGTAVQPGSTVYITSTPSLPLVASLVPNPGGGSLTGNVAWGMQVQYGAQDGYIYSEQLSATQAANSAWDIGSAFNGNFAGGLAVVTATYQGSLLSLSFTILGHSPSVGVLKSAIGTSPWYLQQLAKYESTGYRQFDANGNPVFGGPHGFGVTMIDPGTVSDMWTWTTNVSDGKANDAGNATPAISRWNNQLSAWQSYNASQVANGLPQVPMYTDLSYGPDPTFKFGSNQCVFSYTPSGGQYPFSDGIRIKLYNTGSKGTSFITFDPVNGWKYNDSGNYVLRVCSENP